MFLCNDFTGECSYCYKTVYKCPILYCTCGTEMCPYHTDNHKTPSHKKISISVSGEKPNIEVELEDFGLDINKEEIKSKIKQALIVPKLEKSKLKNCTYTNPADKIVVTTDKCTECPISTNSWICVRCSKVFCGRKQYGIEGNGHALQHNEQNKECCVFIKVQSIDKSTGMCDAYCYDCDDMISHDLFRRIEDKIEKEEKKEGSSEGAAALGMFDLQNQLLNTKTEDLHLQANTLGNSLIPYTVVREEGGISDLGNSCYISSVLQAVAYCLSDCTERLDSLYDLDCERPKECFGCQFKKVIRQIVKSHHKKVETFSVERLCSVVQNVYPIYVTGTQQDAAEYLTDLLSLVAGYDEIGHFNEVFEFFKIRQEIEIICSGCSTSNSQRETTSILYIGSEQRIQDIFEEEELPVICECGGKKRRRTSITRQPKIFTVAVKRELTEGSHPSVEKELKITDKKGNTFSYRLEAAVIHRGTLQAGHYVTQAPLKRSPVKEEIYREYENRLNIASKEPETQETDDSTKKKHRPRAVIPKESAWIVYDNEKIGIEELFSSNAVILFYTLLNE